MNYCTLAPNSAKSIVDNPFLWFTPHYKNQISWLSKVNWLQQAEGTRPLAYKAITPVQGCNFKCDGRISYKYRALVERKMKNRLSGWVKKVQTVSLLTLPPATRMGWDLAHTQKPSPRWKNCQQRKCSAGYCSSCQPFCSPTTAGDLGIVSLL